MRAVRTLYAVKAFVALIVIMGFVQALHRAGMIGARVRDISSIGLGIPAIITGYGAGLYGFMQLSSTYIALLPFASASVVIVSRAVCRRLSPCPPTLADALGNSLLMSLVTLALLAGSIGAKVLYDWAGRRR